VIIVLESYICSEENAEHRIFRHNSFLEVRLLQSKLPVDDLPESFVEVFLGPSEKNVV
jgi:hypothetical protein